MWTYAHLTVAMSRSDGLVRASMMFQPCFLAVVMMLRRMAKFSAPWPDANSRWKACWPGSTASTS